ncbi:MAG TPA: hypothetical protein VIT22_06150, partial [Pseudoxanthomonas sp.]
MKPISSKGAVRLAAAGAAAVIAFGLAGCGKKEDQAGGGSGSSVQSVVKIGHAAPLTGGIAHLG